MIPNGFRRIALAQGLLLASSRTSEPAPPERAASGIVGADTSRRCLADDPPVAPDREQA